MHELSLIADLIGKINALAQGQGAAKVLSVRIKLGALSHVSAAHVREHFARAARGTVAQGAQLDIEVLTDITDPHVHEILLDSVEVEVGL
jgi:hydrogenase nickel incorporation protein HypA/HybF